MTRSKIQRPADDNEPLTQDDIDAIRNAYCGNSKYNHSNADMLARAYGVTVEVIESLVIR